MLPVGSESANQRPSSSPASSSSTARPFDYSPVHLRSPSVQVETTAAAATATTTVTPAGHVPPSPLNTSLSEAAGDVGPSVTIGDDEPTPSLLPPFSTAAQHVAAPPPHMAEATSHSRGSSASGTGATANASGAVPSPSTADTARKPSSSPIPDTASSQKLNDYRERLARDLERRELSARGIAPNPSEKRVSPILEEESNIPPPLNTSLTTASNESGNTIRGGVIPDPTASTPSYPFPRMIPGSYLYKTFSPPASTPGAPPLHLPPFEPMQGVQDRVLSNDSTPASFTFNPSGVSDNPANFGAPEPNLYELSLMLSAEPGLDAWWNTVVQIMRDIYKAERATYDENQHRDDLAAAAAAAYSARKNSTATARRVDEPDPSASAPDRNDSFPRPGLHSRHSFTSYEDNLDCKDRPRPQDPTAAPSSQWPLSMRRSSNYWRMDHAAPSSAEREQQKLSRHALEKHDLLDGEPAIPAWESPYGTERQNQGNVLPVLQALDYEDDPLIDHSGVIRVLERGKTVTLTRSYPYLDNAAVPADNQRQAAPAARTASSGADSFKKGSRVRSNSVPKRSSLFGGSASFRASARGKASSVDKGKGVRVEEEVPSPPTPKYEEYEQAPPSPWSQSPAPSPAVRTDTKENPFFVNATVDEESFNPGVGPANYTGMPPPEAIGIDNSWTVLHVPLTHILLSKPTHPFKLDSSRIPGKKSQPRDRDDAGTPTGAPARPKAAPIAILSILTPVIPYPPNLRHSLEHLAPHMATSFSLCRHYDNLETEIAGLRRRRPSTTGFGAVALDGRPMSSVPLTSPSEYSGVSKSMTGSPAGTPSWDQPSSLGGIADKRPPPPASPAAAAHAGEGYFGSKQRAALTRHDTFGAPGSRRDGSKDSSPVDKRYHRLSATKSLVDVSNLSEPSEKQTVGAQSSGETGAMAPPAAPSKPPSRGAQPGAPAHGIEKTLEAAKDKVPELSRHERSLSHGHTMLHSYGADFASTFQSLPQSSSLASRPPLAAAAAAANQQARTVSYASSAADMPPPSDRLKGLMLDALPAHVFVALPQTGEVVWVNSRYLSYRGQTVTDLARDPWSSIHPDDCEEYLKAWAHSLRTGEQFSRTVRIRRFDQQYRWFYARAVASKDKRGVIMQFLGSYMDIHDQHIAELKAARQEEIEASEAKHRLLANLIPQIIFTATEEDGITFANEQWISYTGQNFDDLLGLGFLDYVHPEDLAKSPTDVNLRGVYKAMSRSDSSGSSPIYEVPSADLTELAKKGIVKVGTDSNGRLSYTTEVRLKSKTGEYRWHLIRCVEIDTIDFGSGASSYFGSATDINDHKILETKLKEAMEAKGRFLSNMSHEIRTPLIGISGMVTFLQDTVLNEEQRDYTNTIQTSANSLIMIINDILDLSKVDAGMMKLKFEWFHTRSLIEDVNELVSTMAIAKGLELNYLVEADVPAWVKGDKVRIRQVLLNVIGNAIKFTSRGEVFSHCRVYAEHGPPEKHSHHRPDPDPDHIMLEYAIIDTGQGFTQQEAELIFKPFSQIDGSSTRQHGGSGLGLVISKQLVELHGGTMGGTATPGKGSNPSSAHNALPTPGQASAESIRGGDSQAPPPTLSTAAVPPPPTTPGVGTPTGTELDHLPPSALAVPGEGADPSIREVTVRSRALGKPVTSVNTGLARFSEAAKASGQDLSQMRLEMPSRMSSPGGARTPSQATPPQESEMRPPMYSILVICPQKYSREATTQHIEMTLPSDMPHQITALESIEEASKFIGGEDPIKFTHIVINLGSAEAVMDLLDHIVKSQKVDNTTILILSDSVQRQAVMKLAVGSPHEKLLVENQVTFIYKPVKPSRFAVIFDPNNVRDLSIDRNRSTAQRVVETQKASYLEIEKRMGNKGYKVLLVEDNPVNQKVLMKYLKKIGVEVDVAVDGSECTDMPWYSDSMYGLVMT
ncbi:Signal transduction histidine kinase [Geosmithia morbida]|uniref:histidine kinase n=1 Tax=Geosmithia morbida TaxID=1094350 RepID=A0A9P5D494_9HYPO|nr:Signal transduction histidine kinase [Geosmithia morbida]KAF4125807.1 Signal transduction histidine kinase [Geosmithia morbida]